MKVGITFGAFDLLHPGHLAMLEEASKKCDYLIVGLHVNPQVERPEKNKPVESVSERYLRLKGCKYVKEIIPYETEDEFYELLLILKPDIRFLGSDWNGKGFTGNLLPMEFYFVERHHNESSSNLRKRIIDSK